MWPMKRVERPKPVPPAATRPPAIAHAKAHAPRSAPIGSTSRGLREARDAIALVRLLSGNITAVRADRVLALLEPHRPRLMPPLRNPLDGMVGQPQGRMLETLLRPVAPIVVDVLLPSLRDHLSGRLALHGEEELGGGLDGAPEAEAEALPSAVEVAEAMRALVRLMRGGGRAHLQAAAAAVLADARADADRIVRVDGPVTRGSIDALAGALLRFEVRHLLLEALGAAAGLQELVFQRRRLARFALRRATEAIDGFAADRGLRALHASLATLASVDGLIVIVLRNLDDQQENREESGAFVEPADRKALNDYLSAAWRLSEALVDMVARAARGGPLDELLFAALLRQLRGLHHFCTDLTHADRPPALDTLEQRLVEHTRLLARMGGERLVGTMLRRPSDPEEARRLLARCRPLAQLLLDMGCAEEAEELALRLLVAGEALKGVAA